MEAGLVLVICNIALSAIGTLSCVFLMTVIVTKKEYCNNRTYLLLFVLKTAELIGFIAPILAGGMRVKGREFPQVTLIAKLTYAIIPNLQAMLLTVQSIHRLVIVGQFHSLDKNWLFGMFSVLCFVVVGVYDSGDLFHQDIESVQFSVTTYTFMNTLSTEDEAVFAIIGGIEVLKTYILYVFCGALILNYCYVIYKIIIERSVLLPFPTRRLLTPVDAVLTFFLVMLERSSVFSLLVMASPPVEAIVRSVLLYSSPTIHTVLSILCNANLLNHMMVRILGIKPQVHTTAITGTSAAQLNKAGTMDAAGVRTVHAVAREIAAEDVGMEMGPTTVESSLQPSTSVAPMANPATTERTLQPQQSYAPRCQDPTTPDPRGCTESQEKPTDREH